MKTEWIPLIYLAAISVLSVAITVYDKIAASKLPRNRVPERVLFFWAAMGGAVAMLLTMHLIRHKTLHKRFMIGLPLMILGQIVLALVVYYRGDAMEECLLRLLEELKNRLTQLRE